MILLYGKSKKGPYVGLAGTLLTLPPLNLTIYYCSKWGMCTKSEYIITHRPYIWVEMDTQAASQVWLGIGGQGIRVRGVPGSIPKEDPLLFSFFPRWQFQMQRLKTKCVKS